MDLSFASDTMRVVIKGTGPLGQFTATVSRFVIKGPVRLLPVFGQRMVLWSFKVDCAGCAVRLAALAAADV
eukprot:148416-Chlamydomonas_euryale.AAC.1